MAKALSTIQHGMPEFNLIHSKEYDRYVSLIAFDFLELNGEDVRSQPLSTVRQDKAPALSNRGRQRFRIDVDRRGLVVAV